MKLFANILACLLVACILTACEHRPLEDPYNAHYVRVYIDEEIKNVTCGFYNDSLKRPEYYRPRVLRVVLADHITHRIVSERYLQTNGEDERGYYVDGYVVAGEGEYDMMIYNFGTERTKIRNENDYDNIKAYTSPISSAFYPYISSLQGEIDKKAIRYCPDHLFLTTCESVKIENKLHVDTLFNAQGDYFTAQSAVKSYYLQVKIKGFEHVTTAVSLLSGMAGTLSLSNRELDTSDAVNVFFDMDYTEVTRVRDASTKSAVLYATFNTFGKLPDENNIYTMSFEFTRSDGTMQVEKIDITSMFDDPVVVENQWILIEKEIEIEPGENQGGGLSPGVEEWGDEWADIQL